MPAPLGFSDRRGEQSEAADRGRGQPRAEAPRLRPGGGCSGFQYGFTFDEVKNEDDAVMEKNGVMLLIDPMSYQYLVGAEIDTRKAWKARSS